VSDRNWNDPQYKAWRAAVRRRDGGKYRLCGSTRFLKAHHIKRWADHPELRFAVSNGVTLCRTCHGKVTGREQEYEAVFANMVGDPVATAQILMMRYARRPPKPG
jgi:5-methylcytosine-specific restriction endonuclease McrA